MGIPEGMAVFIGTLALLVCAFLVVLWIDCREQEKWYERWLEYINKAKYGTGKTARRKQKQDHGCPKCHSPMPLILYSREYLRTSNRLIRNKILQGRIKKRFFFKPLRDKAHTRTQHRKHGR